MFIRAANARAGTGFTGDVNTSFRQGRQDAYRDYIDNFKFALSADVANNAENQRNVQRVATNYGLGLGMDQAARNAAINFLDGSRKIDNAQVDFLTDVARNDHLKQGDVVAERGLAKATTATLGDQNAAVTAQTNLSNANFTNGQLDVTQQTQANNNQAGLTRSETGVVTAGTEQVGATAQSEYAKGFENFSDDVARKMYVERYRKLFPDSSVTDEYILAEYDKDPIQSKRDAYDDYMAVQRATKEAAAGYSLGTNSDNRAINFTQDNKGNVKVETEKGKATKQSVEKADKLDVGKPVTETLNEKTWAKQQGDWNALGDGWYQQGHTYAKLQGNTLIKYNPTVNGVPATREQAASMLQINLSRPKQPASGVTTPEGLWD